MNLFLIHRLPHLLQRTLWITQDFLTNTGRTPYKRPEHHQATTIPTLTLSACKVPYSPLKRLRSWILVGLDIESANNSVRHGQQADHNRYRSVWTDPTGFPVDHTSSTFRLRPDALTLAKQPFEKGSCKAGAGTAEIIRG